MYLISKILIILALMCAPAMAEIDNMTAMDAPNSTTTLNNNLRELDRRLRTAQDAVNAVLPIDLSLYGTTVVNALPIQGGGTGATTAQGAINALLPDQTGNSGKFLTTNSTTVSWGDVVFPSYLYVADTLKLVIVGKSDTARTTTSGTYVKMKEMVVDKSGSLYVSFDLRSGSSSYYAYGRIYKNGVAIGTERTNNSATYITYDETISSLSAGDLIQIYLKGSNGAQVANFRCYATNMIINQD